MNQAKLMQRINEVDPGRYGCTLSELTAIRDAAGGQSLETGSYCFKYGFLKGQREAQAKQGELKDLLRTLSISEIREVITILRKRQEESK